MVSKFMVGLPYPTWAQTWSLWAEWLTKCDWLHQDLLLHKVIQLYISWENEFFISHPVQNSVNKLLMHSREFTFDVNMTNTGQNPNVVLQSVQTGVFF